MALTLPSAALYGTAPLATACVAYPQVFRAGFETNKNDISALVGANIFVAFGQCVGGVPMPQFRLTTGNNGTSPVFGAVRQPAWQYQITGSESVSTTQFGGTAYPMAWGYNPNPSVLELVRQGYCTIQFYDAGSGPVYLEITVWWLNQRDIDPNQFSVAQQNRHKLTRPSLASATDNQFAGPSQFNVLGRRYAIQLAAFETMPADATHCAEAVVYTPAVARWWNGATPNTVLNDLVTLVDRRLTNPDGVTEVLNTNTTTTVEFDITAASLPTDYYAGILRVDTDDTSQFYAAGQYLMMLHWPTGGPSALLPAQYEVDAGSFITSANQAAPITVTGTTRRVKFDIDGTMLRPGATYLPFVLVQDAGASGNWYPFFYPATQAVNCPLLASPAVTDSALSTRFAAHGSAIVAACRQYILSQVGVTGNSPSTYNSVRSTPLGNALQSATLTGYYTENIGGQDFEHTIYFATVARSGGLWPSGAPISVVSTADDAALQATIYLTDADVRNQGTLNVTTGVQVLPPTGTMDLRGKTIRLRWELVFLQGTEMPPYDERVVIEQTIQVRVDDLDAEIVLTDPLTGGPALIICDTDPPLGACVDTELGPDVPFNLILGGQNAASGQAHLYSTPSGTDLPTLTTPRLPDWVEATDADGVFCGDIATSALPLNSAQKLCVVTYNPQVVPPACYCLDFLGGADLSDSEHVQTPYSALLDMGTGPFFVSQWVYIRNDESQGGAFVSRRQQVEAVNPEGWTVGGGLNSGGFLAMSARKGTDVATRIALLTITPGWHHVVFAFESTDPDDWKIYYDGALVASGAFGGPIASFDADNNPPLFLGRDTPLETDDFFNGKLTNVYIAGQGINDAQALTLFEDGICGDPTLLGFANLAYYPLNEVSGTAAPETVNGINGTLTNYTTGRTAAGGGAWQPV